MRLARFCRPVGETNAKEVMTTGYASSDWSTGQGSFERSGGAACYQASPLQLPYARDMDACRGKQYNTDALLDGAEGRNSGEMHTTYICFECWSADKKNRSVENFKIQQGETSRSQVTSRSATTMCVPLSLMRIVVVLTPSKEKNHIEQNSQQKIQPHRVA